MKNKKRAAFLFVFLNVSIIVLIGILDPNLLSVGEIFKNLDIYWIAPIIGVYLIWFATDAMSLKIALGTLGVKVSFPLIFKVAIAGRYYNAITPFASGGQPYQIYFMNKKGIPAGMSTSVLVAKFVVYQMALASVAIVAFIFKGVDMYHYSPALLSAAIIGFILNSGAPLLLYYFARNERVVNTVVRKTLGFMGKIRLLSDPEKTMNDIRHHIKDFGISMKEFGKFKKGILKMAVFSLIGVIAYMSTPWFVYRACGLDNPVYLDMVMIYSFLFVAISVIPTPGASGVSEGGFYLMFSMFFTKEMIFTGTLLWRLSCYYQVILVGASVLGFDGIRGYLKKKFFKIKAIEALDEPAMEDEGDV